MNQILRRREIDLRALLTAGNAWRLEATLWIRQAIESGLRPSDQVIPTERMATVAGERCRADNNTNRSTDYCRFVDLYLREAMLPPDSFDLGTCQPFNYVI